MVNNSDLETRVEALETGLSLANGDIDNLQDSQIVQDERFLAVEIDITDLEDSFTGNLPNICGIVLNLEFVTQWLMKSLTQLAKILQRTNLFPQALISELYHTCKAY